MCPAIAPLPTSIPTASMYTLSTFRRRLVSGDTEREVELSAGTVGWLPAQEHHGENIGDTPTHVIFVELKDPGAGTKADVLGPSTRRAAAPNEPAQRATCRW